MDAARKLRVLAIPDTHAPWANEKVILKIYEILEKQPFDVVIQLGDLFDMYSFSKFARSHDHCTPKEEIEMGFEWSRNFWKNIHLRNKAARKIQIKGNHDDRLIKRAFEQWPAAASIIAKAEEGLFKFKNVETIPDSRDGIMIEDVLYVHGYLTKIGDHTRHHLKNVVHGHTHRGGSIFLNLAGKTLWELDCGFAADRAKAPLMYGPTKNMVWSEGFGIIDSMGPRFVPV